MDESWVHYKASVDEESDKPKAVRKGKRGQVYRPKPEGWVQIDKRDRKAKTTDT
jgi:hypothetical protein